jgi:hypothetical protein
MTPNKRDLKAFVRYDGSGRVVAGSLILRRKKPKVGKWKEIEGYECCNPLVVITYTPLSFGSSMYFELFCNESSIIFVEGIGNATPSIVVSNLNNNLSGLATFTLIGEDTIQLTMTSELAEALCPNGTLSMSIEEN